MITQEWGPVPDDYDYLEPCRSPTPCIVIKTETGEYLALYRVEIYQDEGLRVSKRRLMRPEEVK